MRDFFIRGFEVILGFILVLGILGVLAGAATAALGDGLDLGGTQVSGPVAGALILVSGLVYLLFVGGLMYLGLGIYHNTRRTAEALEMRG